MEIVRWCSLAKDSHQIVWEWRGEEGEEGVGVINEKGGGYCYDWNFELKVFFFFFFFFFFFLVVLLSLLPFSFLSRDFQPNQIQKV